MLPLIKNWEVQPIKGKPVSIWIQATQWIVHERNKSPKIPKKVCNRIFRLICGFSAKRVFGLKPDGRNPNTGIREPAMAEIFVEI